VVVAAGLLVLVGLGLFVSGVVTDREALYWACVAVCGIAAALLVVARARTARGARGPARGAAEAPPRTESTTARTAPQPVATPAPEAGAPESGAPEFVARQPAGATAVRADRVPDTGPPAGESPVREAPSGEPAATDPPRVPAGDGHAPQRRGAHEARETPVDPPAGEPGEEDVEVTDLLLVVDVEDEVVVVDEHPRYHLAGCRTLDGRTAVPLSMVEARRDGFTPCATCRPVRHVADVERARRQAARDS
jgi:hypothetical protein